MSLHSILGVSRVTKKKASSSSKSRSSSSASAWTSSLPRTKPGSKKSNLLKHDDDDDDHGRNYGGHYDVQERLDNTGPIRALLPPSAAGPSNDITHTHRSIRARMFDPVPDRAAGMNSTRIAAVLQFRAALPPVVSAAHIAALRATGSSPAAAERELARLVRASVARRVVVPTRGAIGELVMLAGDLEALVRGSAAVDPQTRAAFVSWLAENPAALTLRGPEAAGLSAAQVDQLVRAGFLTAQLGAAQTGVYARPDERYTMISVETVARAAAGSMAAVGGDGVLHAAGGTGARCMAGPSSSGAAAGAALNVAVPGCGALLKLVAAALAHLAELLQKTRYREMPERDLREKWDGGIAGDKEAAAAKKARGEFAGILPGRTKKWRQFDGLAFEWVLHEAVGTGLVEVFDTRSVGRGVRLV
ncbi:serine-threonine protein kinase 19-domain-containing protein [Lasiosphaeria miniovina]|uniref:Serine-threonine protein kinase 19-domain-containing protein n=1 Tax=Lasiosphaeria miniovina TaxID=1954250 RepID=A0AA40BIH2_9PEZI|nr:serine-threonine protein kinase 19-domain-containing protein [Lasiosphaeria miniovina]KAK0734850.1 serine-threonine protein kinase 19-domain-containing protein [Lasiosphaeria miniovina]